MDPMIEHKILAAAMEPRPGPVQHRLLNRLFRYGPDADRLAALALINGMPGLLYVNLSSARLLDRLSQWGAGVLKRAYYRTAAGNIRLLEDLGQILERTETARIPVVLLQGASIVLEAYPDVGLRPMVDLDLWIRARDGEHVFSLLANLGYAQDPTYGMTFRRGPTTLDLHTDPLGGGRIAARRFLLAVEPEDLFRRCRAIRVSGKRALVPDDPDRIVLLALHALKHGVDRMIWLADIRNLVAGWPKDRWTQLSLRAQRLGQSKAVACVLRLLWTVSGERPTGAAAALDAQARLSPPVRWALRRYAARGALPQWIPLFLASRSRPVGRIAYLLETLFPRPAVLRQVFGHPAQEERARLYIRRLGQLAGTAVGTVRSRGKGPDLPEPGGSALMPACDIGVRHGPGPFPPSAR